MNDEDALRQQQLAQLEMVVKSLMTREAAERFNNIKVAHPQRAIAVLGIIAQLAQQNKIKQVTDELLKEILRNLGEKRQTKINFR